MNQKERNFWLAIRQALLMLVDALERYLGYSPRTAEMRREYKRRVIREVDEA